MRAPLAVLALAAALAAAGCGDDDDGDDGARATVTVTQTATDLGGQVTVEEPETTVSGSNRCPDVVITPNSGDGVFDITTENVTCEEAERLLRSSDGLRSWSCRVVAEQQGRRTTSCSSGNRVIVFATEA